MHSAALIPPVLRDGKWRISQATQLSQPFPGQGEGGKGSGWEGGIPLFLTGVLPLPLPSYLVDKQTENITSRSTSYEGHPAGSTKNFSILRGDQ